MVSAECSRQLDKEQALCQIEPDAKLPTSQLVARERPMREAGSLAKS